MIRQMKGCVREVKLLGCLSGLTRTTRTRMRCLCACVGGGRVVIRVDGGAWWPPRHQVPPPLIATSGSDALFASCLSLVLTTLTHYTHAHLTQVHQKEEAREAQIVPCWVA